MGGDGTFSSGDSLKLQEAKVQPNRVDINISDDVLVQKCQADDSDALERLILKYKDRIYNVIYRICGNAEDSSELTQDAFVKIIENIYKFQGRSSFYTWAFRIAVNLTLNHCRRRIRLQTSSLDAELGGDSEVAKATLKDYLEDKNATDPAQIAQGEENIELILKAINQLDDDQRTVVVLRDIEGMDYAQIAQVVNIELGTVKSRLSRARANLRANLEAMLK